MATPATDGASASPLARLLLAALPGTAVVLWFDGWALLIQFMLVATTLCGTDALVRRWRGQARHPDYASLFGLPLLADGSGLVTALLLTLALPSLAPWWVTVASAAFASLFGKAIFGGPGRNPFNPAMLGYAFALLAFPAAMTEWSAARPGLLASLEAVFVSPGLGWPDGWSQATLLETLKHNQRLTIEELFASDPAFGIVGARAAEWANLAFLAGGLWMLKARVIAWQAPVGLLGALFAISLVCWNGSGSDSNGSPLLHLFSGGTMLAAFFIATDPVSGPASARGKLYFGIGVGLLIYATRAWGGYPDGVAFAVLLMNLCAVRLDRAGAARCPAAS